MTTPAPTPSLVLPLLNEWPFPRIGEVRKRDGSEWVEISQEHADYMRDVLPPIYVSGAGYMVSEAAAHDSEGHAIYCGVVQVGERYFAKECTRGMFPLFAAQLRGYLVQVAR